MCSVPLSTTRNAAEVIRQFTKEFPGEKAPTDKAIKAIAQKFEETRSVLDALAGNVGPKVSVLTDEDVEKVRVYFANEKSAGRV